MPLPAKHLHFYFQVHMNQQSKIHLCYVLMSTYRLQDIRMTTHYLVIDCTSGLARSHRARNWEYNDLLPDLFHVHVPDYGGQNESAMDHGNQESKKTCAFFCIGDLKHQKQVNHCRLTKGENFIDIYLLEV
jgi:hypothetical protein